MSSARALASVVCPPSPAGASLRGATATSAANRPPPISPQAPLDPAPRSASLAARPKPSLGWNLFGTQRTRLRALEPLAQALHVLGVPNQGRRGTESVDLQPSYFSLSASARDGRSQSERARQAGGRAREGAKRNRFTRTAARAANRPPPTPCSKSSTSRRAAPRCRPAPRTSSTSAATPPHSRSPLETPLQAPRLYTRRCAIRGPQGTRTAAKLHGSAHARACVACGWGGRGGCALTVWLALGEWGVWCGGSVCGGDAPKRTSVS